jgi:hypothetical protein
LEQALADHSNIKVHQSRISCLAQSTRQGLRHGNGRRAQMPEKQSPELTVSYSKSFRQSLDVRVVTIERPIGNKSECPGNGKTRSTTTCVKDGKNYELPLPSELDC